MNATYTLIAINALCYFLASNIPNSDIIYGLDGYFLQGFYWQPLTTMFMHGSLTHLLMNMAVLYQFGYLIERGRGWKFFASFYLIGGVATSLFSFAFMQAFSLMHILVGASGAICLLLGFVACKDRHIRVGLIVTILLFSFVPNLFGMNVAWYAHFIGFAIGYAYALLVDKRAFYV